MAVLGQVQIFCLMKLFLGSVVFVVDVLVFQLLVLVIALKIPIFPPLKR